MTEITMLKGKMVITKDAFNVGEITEAKMNNNWKTTHIQVKLTKELGLKNHIWAMLPSAFQYIRLGQLAT